MISYNTRFGRQNRDANTVDSANLSAAMIFFYFLIYFAFVHSSLLYGVEVYENTTSNHSTKLITLNNKLYAFYSISQVDLILLSYIRPAVLFQYTCDMIIKFYHLRINMCIIPLN